MKRREAVRTIAAAFFGVAGLTSPAIAAAAAPAAEDAVRAVLDKQVQA